MNAAEMLRENFTPYSPQCLLYNVLWTLYIYIYTVQYTLYIYIYTVQHTLFTVHCTLNTVYLNLHCTVYTVYCTLYSEHCKFTLYRIHCLLYTVLWTLYIYSAVISWTSCSNWMQAKGRKQLKLDEPAPSWHVIGWHELVCCEEKIRCTVSYIVLCYSCIYEMLKTKC